MARWPGRPGLGRQGRARRCRARRCRAPSGARPAHRPAHRPGRRRAGPAAGPGGPDAGGLDRTTVPRFDGWDHGRSSGAPSSHLGPLGSAPRSHGPRPFRSARHPETVSRHAGYRFGACRVARLSCRPCPTSPRTHPRARGHPDVAVAADRPRARRRPRRARGPRRPGPERAPRLRSRPGSSPPGRPQPDAGAAGGPPRRPGGDGSADHLSRAPARRRAARRHRRGDPRPPGRRHRRRDRVGQDDPDPEDLPRARPRPRRRRSATPSRGASPPAPSPSASPRSCGVELGTAVGYQVRFTDQSSRDTLVKVMTDGILLAEMQRDRDLRRYDTIIIDEAHERSLNIDFILGYLKQLLPRRPDLKVIITSATIDPQRFAEHFADPATGRAGPDHRGLGPHLPRRDPLPPARRPRPARGATERDQVTGVCRGRRGAVDRARTPATSSDILVFFSGRARDPRRRRRPERHEAARHRGAAALRPALGRRAAPRLLAAAPAAGSSWPPTSPRPRSPCRASATSSTPARRASRRYSQRTKVQRLPIEPVSQASRQPARRAAAAASPTASHPALLRGRLRQPPRVHRPRDPAHQPRLGHPPDDEPRARRHRPLPVRRPAGQPPDHRRRPAARGAAGLRARGRPARRRGRSAASGTPPHGIRPHHRDACRSTRASRAWSSRPTSAACLREVLVIVAALSIQDPRERPQDKQELGQRRRTSASPTRRATSSPGSTSGPTSRSSRRS